MDRNECLSGSGDLNARAGIPENWQDKVDSRLLQGAPATNEFLVILSEQADLSGAAALKTKEAKGRYVFERLTETAQRTQPPILKTLQERAWSIAILDGEHDLGARRSAGHPIAGPKGGHGPHCCEFRKPRSRSPARIAENKPDGEFGGVEHFPGPRARRVGAGLHRPGRRGGRTGHRLPMGSSRPEKSLPGLGRHQRQS